VPQPLISAARRFVANPEKTRFTRELNFQSSESGNPAYHIALAATEELKIMVESYCATSSVEVIDNRGDLQKVI